MNSEFYINQSDLELAKSICKYIKNTEVRCRATANSIAANISTNFFSGYDVDIEGGLHNVVNILERLEISDIYINDAYIDVRLYFNKNDLCVPKFNIDNDIMPVAYMFIKIDEDITQCSVTGFITPDLISKNNDIDGYYPIKEGELLPFEEIEHMLVPPAEYNIDDIDSKIYDVNLSKNIDIELIKALITSKYIRHKYITASKADLIFSFVPKPENSALTSIDNVNIETSDNEVFSLNENTNNSDMISDLDENDGQILLEQDNTELEDFDNIEDQFAQPLDIEDNELEINNDSELEFNEQDNIISIDVDEGVIIQEEDDDEFLDNVPQEIETLVNNTNDNIYDITDSQTSQDYIEEFSTETTPSLEAIESSDDNTSTISNEIVDEIIDDTEIQNKENIDTLFETDNGTNAEFSEENLELDTEGVSSNPSTDNNIYEQVDDNDEYDYVSENTNKKKVRPIVPVVALVFAVAGLGYFSYTKLTQNKMADNEIAEQIETTDVKTADMIDNAMPNETVNNVTKINKTEEGNTVTIPAIEQNLDTSIVLSNLSVNWEVPSSYASNNHVKRYLTKLGKIIQLNLKTELLLLSKPPITNKIMVELEYNKPSKNFVVKGITASSGETSVDNVIINTVKNALAINLNINLDSLKNMQGNPILVIHL